MAIQTINVGNLVNDGLGDDLRTAFIKVNANFTELSQTSNATASNVGQLGVGIFKRKTGNNLEFKKLVSGSKTLITETDDNVTINCTQPDAFTSITTNEGIVQASAHPAITVQGGTNIKVKAAGSVITVGEVIDTVKLISTVDFGPVSGTYGNAIQFILGAGDYDFGTYEEPSTFDYDAGAI